VFFQIITMIYWSWKDMRYRSQALPLFSYNSGSCCGRKFRYYPLFWCRNWYCLFLPKEFTAWFRIDAKDNPATLTRRLWSSVFCNSLKVQIVVFCVFNDSCASCKKKESDQLPVNLLLKVRNRYFNYFGCFDENETPW
jgi:hypothetical protein